MSAGAVTDAAPRPAMRRTVAMTLATRLIQVTSGFIGAIITARFLGPTDRGQYFFVVTTALVVVQLANLGLQASNTYKVAQDPRLFGALVANTLWASVGLGLAGAAIAILVLRTTNLFSTERPALLLFTLGLAPAMLVFMLGTNLLVGTERMRTFNIFETIGNVLAVCALVGAGIAGGRVGWFLAASCCAWGLTGVALLVYLVRASHASLRLRRDVFANGFRYAAKAYLIALLGLLVLRSNVFLLQHFDGARELGYYSVAAQVADVLAIFPASVALVLFPRLVRNQSDRWRSMIRAAAAVALMLAVVCAITAVLATPFMRIAFGSAFTPAARVLQLMLPGVFAIGTTTILSQYLAAIGMPRSLIAVWGVGLIVVLGFGVFLIPRHASAGAAVSLSITYWLVLGLIAASALRYRGAGDVSSPRRVPEFDAVEPPSP